MLLPYRKSTIITKAKIINYLLSETHDRGKSKAKFFRGIGFNESNIGVFEKILLTIARMEEVQYIDKEKEDIVIKYTIIGTIKAPNGREYPIKTVWAMEVGSKIPHLATAFLNK